MSTYWDLFCPAHGNYATDGWEQWNRAEKQLALVWRHRAQLIAIDAEIFDTSELEDQAFHKVGRLIPFLRQHTDCPVVLRSEYRDQLDPNTMAKLAPMHCPSCTCEPR